MPETIQLSKEKDLEIILLTAELIEGKDDTPAPAPDEAENPYYGSSNDNNDERIIVDEHRRKILLLLQRYKTSRFSKFLKETGFNLDEDFSYTSNEDLENMINDIRFTISQKNSMNMVNYGVFGGIQVIENLIQDVYKIDGLSSYLKENEQFLDTVEELSIENMSLTYISPQKRMLYIVLTSAISVHQTHSMLAQISSDREGVKALNKANKQLNSLSLNNSSVTEEKTVEYTT